MDWINSHHRESAVTKYNSANLPASLKPEDMLPYFSVGYHRDPTSGRFDLTKASVRVQTSFITFASCVKHQEVRAGLLSDAGAHLEAGTPSLGDIHPPPCQYRREGSLQVALVLTGAIPLLNLLSLHRELPV